MTQSEGVGQLIDMTQGGTQLAPPAGVVTAPATQPVAAVTAPVSQPAAAPPAVAPGAPETPPATPSGSNGLPPMMTGPLVLADPGGAPQSVIADVLPTPPPAQPEPQAQPQPQAQPAPVAPPVAAPPAAVADAWTPPQPTVQQGAAQSTVIAGQPVQVTPLDMHGQPTGASAETVQVGQPPVTQQAVDLAQAATATMNQQAQQAAQALAPVATESGSPAQPPYAVTHLTQQPGAAPGALVEAVGPAPATAPTAGDAELAATLAMQQEADQFIRHMKLQMGLALLEDPQQCDPNNMVHHAIHFLRWAPQQQLPPEQLNAMEHALAAHQVYVQSEENNWYGRYRQLEEDLKRLVRIKRSNYTGKTEGAKEDAMYAAEPQMVEMRRQFILAQRVSRMLNNMGERFAQMENGIKRTVDHAQAQLRHLSGRQL
jgi:hypothetical protein